MNLDTVVQNALVILIKKINFIQQVIDDLIEEYNKLSSDKKDINTNKINVDELAYIALNFAGNEYEFMMAIDKYVNLYKKKKLHMLQLRDEVDVLKESMVQKPVQQGQQPISILQNPVLQGPPLKIISLTKEKEEEEYQKKKSELTKFFEKLAQPGEIDSSIKVILDEQQKPRLEILQKEITISDSIKSDFTITVGKLNEKCVDPMSKCSFIICPDEQTKGWFKWWSGSYCASEWRKKNKTIQSIDAGGYYDLTGTISVTRAKNVEYDAISEVTYVPPANFKGKDSVDIRYLDTDGNPTTVKVIFENIDTQGPPPSDIKIDASIIGKFTITVDMLNDKCVGSMGKCLFIICPDKISKGWWGLSGSYCASEWRKAKKNVRIDDGGYYDLTGTTSTIPTKNGKYNTITEVTYVPPADYKGDDSVDIQYLDTDNNPTRVKVTFTDINTLVEQKIVKYESVGKEDIKQNITTVNMNNNYYYFIGIESDVDMLQKLGDCKEQYTSLFFKQQSGFDNGNIISNKICKTRTQLQQFGGSILYRLILGANSKEEGQEYVDRKELLMNKLDELLKNLKDLDNVKYYNLNSEGDIKGWIMFNDMKDAQTKSLSQKDAQTKSLSQKEQSDKYGDLTTIYSDISKRVTDLMKKYENARMSDQNYDVIISGIIDDLDTCSNNIKSLFETTKQYTAYSKFRKLYDDESKFYGWVNGKIKDLTNILGEYGQLTYIRSAYGKLEENFGLFKNYSGNLIGLLEGVKKLMEETTEMKNSSTDFKNELLKQQHLHDAISEQIKMLNNGKSAFSSVQLSKPSVNSQIPYEQNQISFEKLVGARIGLLDEYNKNTQIVNKWNYKGNYKDFYDGYINKYTDILKKTETLIESAKKNEKNAESLRLLTELTELKKLIEDEIKRVKTDFDKKHQSLAEYIVEEYSNINNALKEKRRNITEFNGLLKKIKELIDKTENLIQLEPKSVDFKNALLTQKQLRAEITEQKRVFLKNELGEIITKYNGLNENKTTHNDSVQQIYVGVTNLLPQIRGLTKSDKQNELQQLFNDFIINSNDVMSKALVGDVIKKFDNLEKNSDMIVNEYNTKKNAYETVKPQNHKQFIEYANDTINKLDNFLKNIIELKNKTQGYNNTYPNERFETEVTGITEYIKIIFNNIKHAKELVESIEKQIKELGENGQLQTTQNDDQKRVLLHDELIEIITKYEKLDKTLDTYNDSVQKIYDGVTKLLQGIQGLTNSDEQQKLKNLVDEFIANSKDYMSKVLVGYVIEEFNNLKNNSRKIADEYRANKDRYETDKLQNREQFIKDANDTINKFNNLLKNVGELKNKTQGYNNTYPNERFKSEVYYITEYMVIVENSIEYVQLFVDSIEKQSIGGEYTKKYKKYKKKYNALKNN